MLDLEIFDTNFVRRLLMGTGMYNFINGTDVTGSFYVWIPKDNFEDLIDTHEI